MKYLVTSVSSPDHQVPSGLSDMVTSTTQLSVHEVMHSLLILFESNVLSLA